MWIPSGANERFRLRKSSLLLATTTTRMEIRSERDASLVHCITTMFFENLKEKKKMAIESA